jgi:hypothetical protein
MPLTVTIAIVAIDLAAVSRASYRPRQTSGLWLGARRQRMEDSRHASLESQP